MVTYPIFGFDTTGEEVATAFAKEIQGKNVLVTGTSLNGIGFETARAVAKHANLVIITGYSNERLRLSEDAIKKEIPSANVRRLTLDLSSLEAVRKAAAEVNAYPEPIHILIHNAAAGFGQFQLTVDKLENQLATDHVGPFLLTKLIKPKLLAAASATFTPRVVFVASGAHASVFGDGVDLDYLKAPSPNKYNSATVYHQAKSANILTASELARRANGAILAYSLHPGVILTNIITSSTDPITIAALQQLQILDNDKKLNTKEIQWKTISQGAATTIAAAFDPRVAAHSGAYLDDCKVATETVSHHAIDPLKAKKLWEVTEEIIGEKFVV
ncbi:Short-chain dehydrogenase/reductase family protein [Mycena indigotica]|uniref:Short-chain dehydrogenase/reductase family protein n=1 Tax=Mycena indigotica TaxID=2126181 RepID=A0A8H6SH22_9AGAR|nr:Short-chain dehydrogenase/reductase family protein [Mycena indigotica]KAF7299480.1 Short-chain dehydrogenase/reductase family protein [Mycena indigotica]